MQEGNARIAQSRLVVAILRAQVDDRRDPVIFGEVSRPLHRKACAERYSVRQPVKVGIPLFRGRSIIFFFNRHGIFFFIINSHGRNLC
jgi:hypothetical protein